MRICVYGSASTRVGEKYIKETEKMGEALAKDGHGLVFGAGSHGLMGAAARGFKNGNGNIIGVIPKFFEEEKVEAIYEFCDELIMTEDMRERKHIMEDKADAFVVTPGGIGTYEEFFEILTLKQLCRHKKPIIIYNMFGFYDKLNEAILSAINNGFIKERCLELYTLANSIDEVLKYVKIPANDDYTLERFKNG